MKCPCSECTCGDNCQCKPGQPGCDACAAFQKKNAPKLVLASVEEIKKAVSEKAIVVNVRRADEVPPSVRGSLRLEFDEAAGTMPLAGLPDDKATPIIVH